jgi:2-methylcitrate dehydratase PrpD
MSVPVNKKPPAVSKVMKQLSAYLAAASKRALPAEVAERAKLHLLDTLAAMVSGSRLLPGQRAIDYVRTLGGSREAGVMGAPIVTTAVNAALANGMCAHADETDDVHDAAFNHPGACVVPAALAMAERYARSGSELLRAVTLGYDIAARTTLALKPLPLFFRGHHPPSFGGVFGAAAAAGSLARLDSERVRYMLSYTAQQTAGLSCLFSDPHHIEKAFDMGGMPAHNGVQAALFAAHGFTGVADVFSGERNFFYAFGPDADPQELARGLGRRYEILNGSIKKWPVGGPILAPLDAIETLRRENPFRADDVKRVIVTIAEEKASVVNNRPSPDINIQYLVSVMLIDGRVTFKSSHDFVRMSDPAVLRYKKRIELVGSRKMTGSQRLRNGHVTLALKDGRTLERYVHAARGSSLNPMTREEEEMKALDLLIPVIGTRRATKLIETVWKLEQTRDVRRIRRLYRA